MHDSISQPTNQVSRDKVSWGAPVAISSTNTSTCLYVRGVKPTKACSFSVTCDDRKERRGIFRYTPEELKEVVCHRETVIIRGFGLFAAVASLKSPCFVAGCQELCATRENPRSKTQHLRTLFPSILKAQPSTPNPLPSTLYPQPSTLNPQPSTHNPQPSTLNPQPSTLNPGATFGGRSPRPASSCKAPSLLPYSPLLLIPETPKRTFGGRSPRSASSWKGRDSKTPLCSPGCPPKAISIPYSCLGFRVQGLGFGVWGLGCPLTEIWILNEYNSICGETREKS